MSKYLKPQTPLYSKENKAYFYPLTTSDQVILPDGSRLNQEGLEGMITPDAIGALSMELLWENASPTSDFAAHEGDNALKFNATNFDWFKVIAKSTTTGIGYQVYFCEKNKTASMMGSSAKNYQRLIKITDSGAEVAKGVMFNTYASWTETEVPNYVIPFQIYGIKGASA